VSAKKWRTVLATLAVFVLLTPMLAASPPELPEAVTGDYFDSGWISLPAGPPCLEISHNLGGDPNDYAVEVLFLDTNAGGLGIHRLGYGGLDNAGSQEGAHWQRLTANTIEVCRGVNDPFIDKVRVRVFVPVPSGAHWDSGWQTINLGQTLTFTHNLGISNTDLTVGLWFRDVGVGNIGIHHLGYGGLDISLLQRRGAHWHHLTDSTVQVTRHANDPVVDEVRVIVVEASTPDYDSLADVGGWQTIAPGLAHTFNHNLNWSPDMLLVRGECRSPGLGIHQFYAGGNWNAITQWGGSAMQRLRPNGVQIRRMADDTSCPEVRVRIWRRSATIFLPLIQRNQ
jgi:hypothetical protein